MFDAAATPGRAGTSTPGWLWRAAGSVALLAVLAGVVVTAAAGSIADAARTVGRDAEPSVALALRMTATLADMNSAAVADSLTDNAAAAATSRSFRDGTAQLADDLVAAARNITYGEAEAEPLRRLQAALSGYEEAVTESRYIGAGDAAITARRVEWASRVNREFAAPAAQALADANASVLERRWRSYQGGWWLWALGGFLALAAPVAALVAVQVWLLRRMRRLLNPPLAAATLIAAAAALWFGSGAIAAHNALRGAKLDAYDSLHVLFEAKAAANDIRAETSLWLLDPRVRPEAAARVEQAEQALLGTASRDPAQAGALTRGLAAASASEQAGDAARALTQVPKTGGLLGAELANVTFGVPERSAASDAVSRLLAAESFVESVQAQAQVPGGQDAAAAVARWLDTRPGGGSFAFAALQAALDRTIAVNQSEFDRDTAAMLSEARLIAPVTVAALLLAVLLSGAGLWLRLREYR